MWSISEKLTCWFYKMNDRVAIVEHIESNESMDTNASTSNNYMITHFPRISEDHQSSTNLNEELLQGSVRCPSCDGTGRIPRAQERQLVALIPFTDKRLKPRRTTLYVVIALFVSLVAFGLCLFFLIPRSITLSSSGYDVIPYYSSINSSENLIKLDFINEVNITNNNYVSITVVNATMNSIQTLDAKRVVGQSSNVTQWTVPLRGRGVVAFNTSVTFDTEFMLTYCKYLRIIYMQFDFMVTTRYLGHDEQTSLSVSQRLSCYSKEAYSSLF